MIEAKVFHEKLLPRSVLSITKHRWERSEINFRSSLREISFDIDAYGFSHKLSIDWGEGTRLFLIEKVGRL